MARPMTPVRLPTVSLGGGSESRPPSSSSGQPRPPSAGAGRAPVSSRTPRSGSRPLTGGDEETASPLASRLVHIFKRGDRNGDGVLSRQEMKWILQTISKNSLTELEIDQAMTAADRAGNGVVSYEEFAAWVTGNGIGRRVLQADEEKRHAEDSQRRQVEERHKSRCMTEKARMQENRELAARLHAASGREVKALDATTEDLRKQANAKAAEKRNRICKESQEFETEFKERVSLAKAYTGEHEEKKLDSAVEFRRQTLARDNARRRTEQAEELVEWQKKYRERVEKAASHGKDSKALSADAEELRMKVQEEAAHRKAQEEKQLHRKNREYEERLSKVGPRGHGGKSVSALDYLKRVEH